MEILKDTAKTIGSALGTVAAKTGLAAHQSQPSAAPRKIDGRFQKTGKTRTPRKEKKLAAKKLAKTKAA
jgi:hypothetical protein